VASIPVRLTDAPAVTRSNHAIRSSGMKAGSHLGHLAGLVLVLAASSLPGTLHADGNEAPLRELTRPQDSPVNENALVMVAFKARVEEYAKLQVKMEQSLPKLPDEATPQQIDSNQRALAALIKGARPRARAGELFTTEMQAVVRELMAQVFKDRRARAELRAAIAEENPRGVRLRVNDRYPDAVPLTTMPPEVLQNLPLLPKDVEYRFVGDSLILLDSRAHIVVDFMRLALPPA
jgi:hypothetical protein